MQNTDTYFSIGAPSEGFFKDQGSRFISLAFPVETREEVARLLENARKEYHDARHHCVAFRIGYDGALWRASDDGEPSGSAGRQILGQIDSAGLSDVAVIVVRYFGGIKLGIPGLVRAYRCATADALSKAARVEKTAGSWWTIGFGYDSLPAVMKTVKEMDLPQRAQDFGQQCSLQVRVRLGLRLQFIERMSGFILSETK